MNRKLLQVYFIMGTENVVGKDPLEVLEDALQAGITIFQFREKGMNALTGDDYVTFAKECQRLCKQYHVPFIVNDDVDLAIEIGADGVHIGQDDERIDSVKSRIGKMLLGVSVHTEAELQKAITYQADYVGIGPIFETISKKDAKKPAGVSFLQFVAKTHPELPIVAIGGITEGNVEQLVQAGSDGVAVISALCKSKNRMGFVQTIKQSFEK